jgi:hypothetical protein
VGPQRVAFEGSELNWLTGGTLEANCPDCEAAQTPEAALGAMRQMARGVSPPDSCGEPAAQARVGQALGLGACGTTADLI